MSELCARCGYEKRAAVHQPPANNSRKFWGHGFVPGDYESLEARDLQRRRYAINFDKINFREFIAPKDQDR